MFGQYRHIPGLMLMVVLAVTTAAPAQPSVQESSPTQLMLDVVASNTSDPQLRLKHALALVQDPQAHLAIIDLLMQSTDLSTRTIICQALAYKNGQGQGNLLKPYLPEIFIDPLIMVLCDEQKTLSHQAAAALGQCPPDAVLEQLEYVLANPVHDPQQQRAAIEVLSQLPGKKTVLMLAGLLNTPDDALRQDAWKALNNLIPIPDGMKPETFIDEILPQLKKMNDAEIVFRQYRHLQDRSQQLQAQFELTQQEATSWRQEYLNARSAEFVKLTDSAQKLDMINKFLTSDSEPALRIQALSWTNDWLTSGAVPAPTLSDSLTKLLMGYISDPNAQVRRLCAMTLGKIPANSETAAKALLEQLKQETSVTAQAAQLDALGALRYLPAVEIAIDLVHSKQSALSIAASRAMGNIVTTPSDISTDLVETITTALLEVNTNPRNPPALRVQLITAMGKIAAQSALRSQAMLADDALRQALDDENAAVRTQAVRALRHLHSAAVMPMLIDGRNMLNDPDEAVRFAVLEAVNQFGERSHLKPLQDRLLSEVSNEALAREIRNGYSRIFSGLAIPDGMDELNILHQSPQPDQTLLDKNTQILLEKIRQAMQNDDTSIPSRMQLLQLALLTENLAAIEALAGQMPALAASSSGEQVFNTLTAKVNSLELTQPNDLRRAVRLVAALIAPLEKYPSDDIRKSWDNQRTKLATAFANYLITTLEPENGAIDPADVELLNQLKKGQLTLASDASREEKSRILQQYCEKLLNQTKPQTPDQPVNTPKNDTKQPAAAADAADKPKTDTTIDG